jgi:hypothetical protein
MSAVTPVAVSSASQLPESGSSSGVEANIDKAVSLLSRADSLYADGNAPTGQEATVLNGQITQLLRDPGFNADRAASPELNDLAGRLEGVRRENDETIADGTSARSPQAIAGWTAQAGEVMSSAGRALLDDGRVSIAEAREVNGKITQLLSNRDFNAAEQTNPELKQLGDQLRQVRSQFDKAISLQNGASQASPTTPPSVPSPTPSTPTTTPTSPSSTPSTPTQTHPGDSPAPSRPEVDRPRCPTGLRC